ncbi:MAG TPA: transposase [Hanamia sp.]|nr:transposase [Hanamia sp.]
MKKHRFIMGVDVSKNTLDIYCTKINEHLQIQNGTVGFREFLLWCKTQKVDMKNCIVVMEYTGGYEYKLVQFCESKKIPFMRIPGLAIKHSLGIIRGKNDKVDSKRIAQYAFEKYSSLQASKPLDQRIVRLKELLKFRKRLVRENAGYQATIKERKHIYPDLGKDIIIKELGKKLGNNEQAISKIEAEIMKIIEANDDFKINYDLVTSIKGIGKVNAWMTIAYTENFTSFPDGRTYAVYVGVIPFDHSSGTSIKGKKRVSNLANKELKSELSQAAKSAMQWDKEIREYADRKLKEKQWGTVVNNVKFKLILRMFAVVKRGTKYVDNSQIAA